MTIRHRAAILAALVLPGGCAVGPDFSPPPSPAVGRYVAQPSQPATGGKEPAQRIVEGGTIPAAWWRLFHSPTLDRIVRDALANSPSVDAARHRLSQAEQAVAQVRGAYYPQVDMGASAQRVQGPAFALGLSPAAQRQGLPVYNLYSLGPVASFSPDVFGLTARRVEQQAAEAELSGYQLAAAQLGVTGNAVATAVAIAALRRQIATVEAIVADDEKSLGLVRARQASGKVAKTDLLAAESQLAADQTLLPPLRQQLAVAEDALAVLVGKFPAEWKPPAFDLADFTLPAELPVSVPSTLVRQRPDIMAAEARLHAGSAAIGVATAQMYPNIALSASVTTVALSPDSLFGPVSLAWNVAGGLAAPIFHGGSLSAQKQAAIEGYHADEALYRQTVLQAFGQVADVLRALDNDSRLAEAQRHALDTAAEELKLQRLSYAAGRSDLIRLLDAERGHHRAQLGYIRAQAQRVLDSAALLVAMGGGWVDQISQASP